MENLTLISSSIIEVVEDWHQDVQYITALKDIKQELLWDDEEKIHLGTWVNGRKV